MAVRFQRNKNRREQETSRSQADTLDFDWTALLLCTQRPNKRGARDKIASFAFRSFLVPLGTRMWRPRFEQTSSHGQAIYWSEIFKLIGIKIGFLDKWLNHSLLELMRK